MKLEIWQAPNKYTSLIYANQLGDSSRSSLPKGSRLLHIITAKCHYDAMIQYHQYMGWEKYTTNIPEDHLPYTDKFWFGGKL